MGKIIIILFSSFLLVQCSVDRTIVLVTKAERIDLVEYQKLDNASRLFITDDDEPGDKLMLCLTFVDLVSQKPISNQKVSFYHTSADGEYQPLNPNDETTARLSGFATTNDSGGIYVETILPGDYGSSEDNRHIHTSVYDAKPEAYDIFFKQYSSKIGKYMNSDNDQIFYADLKKTSNNKLVCFVRIEVKKPKMAE